MNQLLNIFPDSILQMSTIFLSIIIEALPFVLLGCLASGFLHVFLSAEIVQKIIPRNRVLAVLIGSVMGLFFPSCECGIVPIVHRFMQKRVPRYTAFPFMLSAPIINPVVIFSTYIAFGRVWKFVILRVLGSVLTSIVVGFWIAFWYRERMEDSEETSLERNPVCKEHSFSGGKKIWFALEHSVDEFFDTGRFLMIGSLAAASMQTWLPTKFVTQMVDIKAVTIVILLLLAFTLSLCSEADAFIGSSLLSMFGVGPIVAFLIFGPMVDIKNLLMMVRYFEGKFIIKMVGLISLIVFLYSMLV